MLPTFGTDKAAVEKNLGLQIYMDRECLITTDNLVFYSNTITFSRYETHGLLKNTPYHHLCCRCCTRHLDTVIYSLFRCSRGYHTRHSLRAPTKLYFMFHALSYMSATFGPHLIKFTEQSVNDALTPLCHWSSWHQVCHCVNYIVLHCECCWSSLH